MFYLDVLEDNSLHISRIFQDLCQFPARSVGRLRRLQFFPMRRIGGARTMEPWSGWSWRTPMSWTKCSSTPPMSLCHWDDAKRLGFLTLVKMWPELPFWVPGIKELCWGRWVSNYKSNIIKASINRDMMGISPTINNGMIQFLIYRNWDYPTINGGVTIDVPSGNLSHSYGKSQFLMRKSSIIEPFSLAMLVYWTVTKIRSIGKGEIFTFQSW